MSETTDIGPLASVKQSENVWAQVERSLNMGAKLLAGGRPAKALYPPTLLVDVRPGMPVFDEEVFGPVAPVITAKDINEAVSLANQTRYGLGVTVFAGDLNEAEKVVSKFDDGAVFINELVKSDPRLPFGGTKSSGYGRELAMHGIREFVNVKTVYIKKA
jgi:succinate-semialdehyde dehydrogenase/glutarate-semialdehyde dehydrogenase